MFVINSTKLQKTEQSSQMRSLHIWIYFEKNYLQQMTEKLWYYANSWLEVRNSECLQYLYTGVCRQKELHPLRRGFWPHRCMNIIQVVTGQSKSVPPSSPPRTCLPAVFCLCLSLSFCPALPQPPLPPEAQGRRGGTGACDWPLHYTACTEPVDHRWTRGQSRFHIAYMRSAL